MKYTDEEYKVQLEELSEIIEELQTSDQVRFQDDLDNALSNLQTEIMGYLGDHK